MTNQQGAPEALRLADRLSSNTGHVGGPTMDAVAAELRRLHAENTRLAALVEAQQPAPSAAAPVGEAPLPLLVRDIAADLGTTPIQVCTALAQLGFGGHSVNMAVTPRMAKSLRAHFAPPTPQADSAQAEPLQAFDSPRAKALMRAWEEGWAACRDAEYVGEEAQNDAFNSSHTLTLCIAEDQQLPAPQADSQPAPVEVADAMADSQYLAGVSAGWNAANADDPNAALQKLHESRAGYLKPLSAARAPADSVTAPAGGAVAGPGWQMVPVKPTPEMLRAGDQKTWVLPALDCWRAMLAAAPAPLAHAADSVLEDAVGLINDIDTHMRSEWSAGRLPAACWPLAFSDRIKTIIAARKQGANHD